MEQKAQERKIQWEESAVRDPHRLPAVSNQGKEPQVRPILIPRNFAWLSHVTGGQVERRVHGDIVDRHA